MAGGVQGIDRVGRFFDRLPRTIKAELEKETERSAQDVASLARALAPVESGTLKASVHVTPGATSLTRNVEVGGGEAFYARFVLFGTKPHKNKGKFAGSENPGIRPNPFLFTALRTLRKAIRSRMGRAIGRGVKAAGR